MNLNKIICDWLWELNDKEKYEMYMLYAKANNITDTIPRKMEEFNSYFKDKTQEEIEDMEDCFDEDDEYFWLEDGYLYSGSISDLYGELVYEWIAEWLVNTLNQSHDKIINKKALDRLVNI